MEKGEAWLINYQCIIIYGIYLRKSIICKLTWSRYNFKVVIIMYVFKNNHQYYVGCPSISPDIFKLGF